MADRSLASTRRRLLLAVGASSAMTGLAGCSFRTTEDGFSIDLGGGETTPTPPASSSSMPTATTTPTAADGPMATNTPTDTTTTDRGTRNQGATETATQRQGGTLRLTSATLTSLDPIAATDEVSIAVIENVFDGLTTFPNGETRARLQLANDISVTSDGRTYTVTLKPNATFHDGSPVTASSVVYSWERLAASSNARQSYTLLDTLGMEHDTQSGGQYAPGSLEARALDSQTLEFTLSEPFPATRELLAFPALAPVPEGIVGDVDGYSGQMAYEDFTENPIGSGPFVLERWGPNTEVVVSRFADYHGRSADLDHIHWQVINDTDARFNYGQNRNADFLSIPDAKYDPSKRQVTRTDDIGRRFGSYGPMRNGETVAYLSTPLTTTFYVAFNTDNVDKPGRQALAYAMNQHELVDHRFRGRAAPAYHLTPPALYPNRNYESHASGSYPYGYDDRRLDDAREVMEDAGYSASNQYEFTFTHYESRTWQVVGRTLSDALSSAHIDVKLEETPYSTLLTRGRSGNIDAYTLGKLADYPGPDDFLEHIAPPNTDYRNGSADGAYMNWRGTDAAEQASDAWDRIELNQGPGPSERRTREAAYVTMEEANWEDACLVPVYHPIDERFSYTGVDVAPFGGLGRTYQEYDGVVKNG